MKNLYMNKAGVKGAMTFRLSVLDPRVWAPLALVLLGILFFADFLFTSKNLYFRDILDFHYPLRKVLIDSYAHGEWPLWNPYVYMGQPMLANPNYMAFYPTNLLHLMMPFNYAFKLHFIIHPLLAGLGFYFLQRRLRIHAVAALCGSIAYQFSGPVLSFLNLYNIIPAVALMPWIGWAFAGALEAKWLRRSLVFGTLVALQVIALEPLTFQCTALLILSLAIHHYLESETRREALKGILRTGAVGAAFALGLASIQVLPTLELLPRAVRGTGYGYEQASAWSLHPMDLVGALIPNFYGNPYAMGYACSWGEAFHHGREPYIVSFFCGAGVVFFAFCSIFISRRRKLQRTFAWLTLGAISLALGSHNPLNVFIYQYIPMLGLGRYPSKYFLFASLAICLLTALTLEALMSPRREPEARRRNQWAGMCGLIAAGAIMGCMLYWKGNPLHLLALLQRTTSPSLVDAKDWPLVAHQLTQSLLYGGVFLFLCSGLFLLLCLGRLSYLKAEVLVFILAAELIPPNLRIIPSMSDADVNFVPEVNYYLQQEFGPRLSRVCPPTQASLDTHSDLRVNGPNRSSAWLTLYYRRSGQPFYGIINGIQYSLFTSIDNLNTMESERLSSALAGRPLSETLTLLKRINSPIVLSVDELADPQAELLSVFETRSNLQLRAHWLKDTMDRAFWVPAAEVVGSPEEAFQRIMSSSFPYHRVVVLETALPGIPAKNTGEGTAKIREYHNNHVLCETSADASGYLVLLDTYYPGWKAYVDGKEAVVSRANYAFRAVSVPGGRHVVEFRCRPQSFYLGLMMTVLTALLGCCFWILGADKYARHA